MKNFVIYNSTGKILRTGRCADEFFNMQVQAAGELIREGTADDASQYVDIQLGIITGKQAMTLTVSKNSIVANGVDAAVISGIPISSSLALTTPWGALAPVDVTDGQVVFTADQPGEYRLSLSSDLFQTQQVTINAT